MRHPIIPIAALAMAAACARPARMPAPVEGATPSDSVDLVVAATTDVHGRLRGWDYYADRADPDRGLTRAATIVDSVREAAPGRVVLVDAGDLLQGNPLDYVAARIDTTSPHPVIAAMNTMAYDAAVVGNHEFNYGLPTLWRAIGAARFPFLAANVTAVQGTAPVRAYTIVQRAGVRVGIVGATTPGSMVWDRDNLRGRLTVGDVLPATGRAVAAARAAGADVIVVLLHSGLDEPSSYDTVSTGLPSENVAARVAREVPGIDLIVYGHSHKQMADTTIAGVLLMQPKNWATSVGVAHLEVVRRDGRWHVAAKHSSLVQARNHAESPAVLAATQTAHEHTVAYATTPIGRTPVAWRADSARVADTPLMDFILEVERRATNAQIASTAAFSLDASLDSGAVTVARIAALYPYDNTLRVIRISGAALRQYLEQSARYYLPSGEPDPKFPGYNYDMLAGVDYALDISRPFGDRVTKLEYDGRPVAATDTFTMALNNYRQTGGGGYAMLAGAPVTDDRQLEIRQLLIDEVRRRGTIRPDDYFHRNWTLGPPELVARAYAAMNRETSRRAPMRAPAAPNDARPSAPLNAPRLRAEPLTGPRLRIVAINDFHGALEPRPDDRGVRRGGAAALVASVRRAVAECSPPDCHAIVLDGGDEFQGTPASNLAYGRTVVPIFERMGVAASALGNHEFDWGQDSLRARMRQARYDVLGANARTASGRDVRWIRDDTIIDRGGVKVGVIGVSTTETKRTTKASNTVGLTFVDPAPIVDSLTRRLRARGADAVVVIAHAGAFCQRAGTTDCAGEIVDLARKLTEHVDAIVSGHTHSLVNTVVNGIPIVQARSRGTAYAVMDIPLPGGAPERAATHAVYDVLPDSIAGDSVAQRLVEQATRAVAAKVDRPVGRIAADMPASGNALGNLIADAMRVEGKGDVAFMNDGGIRAPLRAGVATYGSLFEVEPFANVLYRVTVRGRDLRAYVERMVAKGSPRVHTSGIVVRYDSTRAPGARVLSVSVGGTPLADDRVYSVIINDFMALGGDVLGFGSRAITSTPLSLVDLDALVRYVREHAQPVAPPDEARFIVDTNR